MDTQNMQRALGIAGSESELRAAFEHARKTGRTDLVNMLSSGSPDGVALAAEMAARAYKASQAQSQRANQYRNVPVQDLVQPQKKQQEFTPQVYAEALMRLRRTGEWDGADYSHPIVKELGARMQQNMHTLRVGNVGARPVNSGGSLSINDL